MAADELRMMFVSFSGFAGFIFLLPLLPLASSFYSLDKIFTLVIGILNELLAEVSLRLVIPLPECLIGVLIKLVDSSALKGFGGWN